MLDFSYKRPVILGMANKATEIIILDHHKTAEADLTRLPAGSKVKVIFDLNKSGARLAWEYFHPDEPVPLFVQIVEDRDLWRFALPGTREISAVVFSHPYDFNVWNGLSEACDHEFNQLVFEGRAIERKHHRDIAELVAATKRRMTIGGSEVWVANLPYTLTSDAGHLMCEGGEPFASCYWDTPEGRTFSLRSRDDGADVSEIAKLYGGGGHPHAAGFRLPHGVEP
jgi:oligoribonuclease NrnB/cAMP/cGMP phosphodiesterase (DHH superfamily)